MISYDFFTQISCYHLIVKLVQWFKWCGYWSYYCEFDSDQWTILIRNIVFFNRSFIIPQQNPIRTQSNIQKCVLNHYQITLPNTIFSAVNYDIVLSFFPARQVSEIILNESSKSTKNALIEWLQIGTTKYFLKSKVYLVSLVISVVWNFSSTSGLSQIWNW
jgi:hypothetical protein